MLTPFSNKIAKQMYGPSITHNEKHCQKTTLKLDESLKSSFLFIPPPPPPPPLPFMSKMVICMFLI